MDFLEFPFRFIRVPKLKLKLPNFYLPSSKIAFAFVFFSYFLVISGVIYDIIVEPPSIGSSQDPVTKALKPIVILQYRVNGQYIIEGLAAGLLFCLGGGGVIALDLANVKHLSERNRFTLFSAGILCILAAYTLSMVFLRIKVPGYLKT
jgi:hypothetical protein